MNPAVYSSESILWHGHCMSVKFLAPLEVQASLLKAYEDMRDLGKTLDQLSFTYTGDDKEKQLTPADNERVQPT